MKDMMLQAKNSNNPKDGLTAQRSNRWLAIGLTVLCTILFTGCKDKEQEPQSLVGTTAKPAWAVPAEYDLTSSMTAVVRVDLSASFTAEQLAAAGWKHTADDLLAAFSGETCLGVATYVGECNAYWLYITAPKSGGEVTLRYYSASLKQFFVSSKPVPYKNDDNLGSVSAPYTPQFICM